MLNRMRICLFGVWVFSHWNLWKCIQVTLSYVCTKLANTACITFWIISISHLHFGMLLLIQNVTIRQNQQCYFIQNCSSETTLVAHRPSAISKCSTNAYVSFVVVIALYLHSNTHQHIEYTHSLCEALFSLAIEISVLCNRIQ